MLEPPPRTRILFLTTHASYFVSHRLAVARFLRDQGIEIIVATAAGPGVALIEREGFRFCHVPFRRESMNVLSELHTLFRIARLYIKEKPSLTHHVGHKPILYGAVAGRLAAIGATVGTVTGLGYAYAAPGFKARGAKLAIEMLYRLFFYIGRTHLIFQNPDDRALFVRKRFISPTRTSLIAGSGVDCHTFITSPEPEGVPIVVLAARMLRDKGVEEFVDAAKRIKQRGIHAKFILAGAAEDSNPSNISEAELLGWNRAGAIEWIGYCLDIPALMTKTHIVCLPSYREGLPLVLAEAAAAGKPIVTTDTPGCREVVQDGVNGFLVPIRDSQALANRIESLLLDGDMRRRMGIAGRFLALQKFSIEHVVAQTVEVYQSLGVKIMRVKNPPQ